MSDTGDVAFGRNENRVLPLIVAVLGHVCQGKESVFVPPECDIVSRIRHRSLGAGSAAAPPPGRRSHLGPGAAQRQGHHMECTGEKSPSESSSCSVQAGGVIV